MLKQFLTNYFFVLFRQVTALNKDDIEKNLSEQSSLFWDERFAK